MNRGKSLAPLPREGKPTTIEAIPEHLRNSLLERPVSNLSFGTGPSFYESGAVEAPLPQGARGAAAAGGYGTAAADVGSSASPFAGVSSPAGGAAAAPSTVWSYVPWTQAWRQRRAAANGYQRVGGGGGFPTTRIRVFDEEGNLTTRQVGVNTFQFRSLSFFYLLRAQPWTALITYSVMMYLSIVLLITLWYRAWGAYCGAGVNMVGAIYFTVVSLAANGGYLGEDEDTMTDSNHMCYRGRTAIVMFCSYVNIIFVGLVAALVVGKAEYAGKLGHRVVFSTFCALSSVPGRIDQWKLTFRMTNVENMTPLTGGRLRLFCVTAEPLKQYRLRRQYMRMQQHQGHPHHHHRRGGSPAEEMEGRVRLTQELLRARMGSGGAGSQRRSHRRQARGGGVRNAKKKKVRRSPTGDEPAGEEEGESESSSSSPDGSRSPTASEHSSDEDAAGSKKDKDGAGVIGSEKTNSSVSSHGEAGLYDARVVGSPIGRAGNPLSGEDDEEREVQRERVHLRVQEMKWTCNEEIYLDRGQSGQLSLWYPVTINHVIDSRSPLYPFMGMPHIAASLSMADLIATSGSDGEKEGSGGSAARRAKKAAAAPTTAAAHNRFQIVAVFEATELESGSTITAKHTYAATDVVTHFKFSDRLVHMQPESSEILLDYHYFNTLLPMYVVEPSTTDTE